MTVLLCTLCVWFWTTHIQGGDSNDATCAVVRITCKALLSSKYMVDSRKYDTSDFAVSSQT